MRLGELVGFPFMGGLGDGEIPQELARLGVLGALSRGEIERVRLALHVGRLLPNAVEAEILDQPDRLARVEIRDMFAADRQDDVSEPCGVAVDQPVAMLVFLLGHAEEHRRRGRKLPLQAQAVGGIDAPIFLFRGNGERHDLLLRKTVEPAARKRGKQAHRRASI